MKKSLVITIGIILFVSACFRNRVIKNIALDEPDLIIKKISKNSFVHISYLDIPNYGPFPCNGMIFKNGKEAVVFDTPLTIPAAKKLIEWLEKEQKCTIKAVIVNHFHNDCLESLDVFHDRGIPSYAHQKTIESVQTDSLSSKPQKGFTGEFFLSVGKSEVVNTYFGPAHTHDNIISYIPSEKVLFGGCMVKSLKARKGNLADANVEAWPLTIQKVKNKYPDVKVVIPGHGDPGGSELLDYTIHLFSSK